MKKIITDFIELFSIENGKEVKRVTHDSAFYNDRKVASVSSDACGKRKEKNKKTKDEFYAIVTTTDKEINNRIYDAESTRKNVLNKDWTHSYQRPILKNHDLYSGEPVGRITDTYLVNHASGIIETASENELPNEVFEYFKSLNLFADGSTSTIAKFYPDDETGEKIKDGFYVTVSQSSSYKKDECSICGKSYFGGDCMHIAGRQYEVKDEEVSSIVKCLVKTFDYTPIELSLVNCPANDSSIICVYNTETKKVNTSEDFFVPEESEKEKKIVIKDEAIGEIDNNEKQCEDGQGGNDTQKDEGGKMKDLVKKMITKKIEDSFVINDSDKNAVSELLESISDEQVFDKFDKFLDAITSADSKEVSIEENSTNGTNDTVEETAQTNDNANSENQESSTAVTGANSNVNEDLNSEDKKIEDLKQIHEENKKSDDKNVLSPEINAILGNLI